MKPNGRPSMMATYVDDVIIAAPRTERRATWSHIRNDCFFVEEELCFDGHLTRFPNFFFLFFPFFDKRNRAVPVSSLQPVGARFLCFLRFRHACAHHGCDCSPSFSIGAAMCVVAILFMDCSINCNF